MHGICVYVAMDTGPRKLTEDLAELVAQGDIEGLASMVSTMPVQVFRARNAIQVVGCDGETIVGHVPAAPRLLESLQIAVAQADIQL